MTRYCTYFDRNYLANGLALWESLRRHAPGARLDVLALDEVAARILRALGDDGLRVWTLADVLAFDTELAAVQGARPRGEFIFTLTPCLLRFLMTRDPDAATWVYLDADLLFFSDAGPILADLGAASVLVYAHRFPAWHDEARRYGRFNVGVLAFRPDASGRACVAWWRERCLESCAVDADRGVYGDQKYLDAWPEQFGAVAIGSHPGVNLAPWNWAAHALAVTPAGVTVNGSPLVVYHFAQFRWIGGRWYDSGQLEYGVMPAAVRAPVYGAYAAALDAAVARVRRIEPNFALPQRGWRAALGPWHLALLRLFWGQCWRRGATSWLALGTGLGRWSGRFMGAYRRRQRGSGP